MSSVLFDVPGPRARLRHRLYAILGIVVLVAVIGFVLYRFAESGQFDGAKWSWIQYEKVQLDLIDALVNTLKAFAAGAVLALLFGAVFAAGQLSDHKVIRVPSMVVVELFRAVPLVVLIFVFHYGLSLGAPFYSVVLGLTLYNGSVLAEVFRAGVLSLPRGQSEEAYAVGMRKTQVMTLILLPQAVKIMLPAIISQCVVALKDTSLGMYIIAPGLTRVGKQIWDEFHNQFQTAIVLAVLYIVVNLVLTAVATLVQRRFVGEKKALDVGMTALVGAGDGQGRREGGPV